eukprot:scaffold14401_cov58-Cyclotella_meneghiniana.AAC.23
MTSESILRRKWKLNKCPAGDGWLGFRYSLIPKVTFTYGFVAITIDPDVLESSFQKLYRDVLLPLHVNENITKFYRMAPKPKRVMGLGVPNPCMKMLAYKLHLLQTEWNQCTAAGQMIRQSLEIFQMETGLSTNVIEMDYHRYDVQFQLLGNKWLIPLLRVGDKAIMDVICSTDLFSNLPGNPSIVYRNTKDCIVWLIWSYATGVQ